MLAALGALLGAAAAAPSENQPAHATLLFAQRAKAELADWQAQAKHAKLQAEKAEEEAVAAEKEYRKALELEASRRAFRARARRKVKDPLARVAHSGHRATRPWRPAPRRRRLGAQPRHDNTDDGSS